MQVARTILWEIARAICLFPKGPFEKPLARQGGAPGDVHSARQHGYCAQHPHGAIIHDARGD